jgi:anaerobic dimethyl sulfoxide reductase subunit B (iron-sulfur subunit)
MCYDKLESGELPVCVMACPGRALDFGPIEELEQRYGSLRALEDMPSPDACRPAIFFKPMTERKNLVPYDEEKALSLMQDRGGSLPPTYRSVKDIKNLPDGLIGYSKLVMKAPNVKTALALSKNEEG